MLQSDIMIELHIPGFQIAKNFYGSLGFRVVWERAANDKERGYMVMRRGSSIINFYGGDKTVSEHSYFKRFDKTTSRGYAVEIIIPIDMVEDFYEEFKKLHKDKIVKELNHKYTKPDFRAIDPFGFYLRFVERYDWVNSRDKEGNELKIK